MRVVTGIPRCTPIRTLQEEAQLNTIDELIHQRRQARDLKPSFLQPAADLAAYMGSPTPFHPETNSNLLTTNPSAASEIRSLAHRLPSAATYIEEADMPHSRQVHWRPTRTDASCTDIEVVTSTVVQGRPSISANHVYRLTAPVLSPAPVIIIRTDSTSAIKKIRKVYNAHPVADEIHRMTAQMPGQIRIQWIPRDAISAHIHADAATHTNHARLAMIQGLSPLNQAVLGTMFTWGMTAAGAALVFVLNSTKFHWIGGDLKQLFPPCVLAAVNGSARSMHQLRFPASYGGVRTTRI
ncbi:hypothetical protein HPB49_018237 [Dermacentor silvarum]|uniref:Uncharacterized protein n=1 Tax=Dermacentor silvarum TaxID=543639 RepID=A0ACB8CSD7_DERSI|nr:hypothetical protein HPB49_018237 [Dermacentor silvarum]